MINDGVPKEIVAKQVGYNNYSVFYRAYRNRYGIDK
jgi:AraC-like DNA-binding protein